MSIQSVTMPCGWCGVALSARQMRVYFAVCPKKPKPVRRLKAVTGGMTKWNQKAASNEVRA